MTDRLAVAAPWIFGVVTVLPLLFVGWHAAAFLRNAPFWDEFRTVLDFLGKYRQTDSWSNLLALLFSESDDQHRIITSRLLYIAIYELTDGVNFIYLTLLGNFFGVAAIAVIVWQQSSRTVGWLLASVLSLLVFQMQHYENLFLSYASIDHFHVVLLSAASLALLARGGRALACAALAVAGLAVFTLTHGLAVFPAGAALLALQRRWRALAAWSVGTVAVAIVFFWDFEGAGGPLGALTSPAGWSQMTWFWLTLLGGVPAVGSPQAAPVFGALGLGATGWLWHRGAFQRKPFLGALAVCTLVATLLISYGRFNVAGIPPLGSRYMVQSAVFWAVLLMLTLKMLGDTRAVVRAGLAILPVLVGLNVAANVRFFGSARHFAEKRIATTRYFDKRGTFANAPHAIFPNPRQADLILSAAAQGEIFRLQPRGTPPVPLALPPTGTPLSYYLDEITVGLTHVHIRGWVLPPSAKERSFQPHVVLRAGGQQLAFRGYREDRPDVAKTFQRPDATRCGFYFLVPRSALPKGQLEVALALVGRGRTLLTGTDHKFVNQRTATIAGGPGSSDLKADD